MVQETELHVRMTAGSLHFSVSCVTYLSTALTLKTQCEGVFEIILR